MKIIKYTLCFFWISISFIIFSCQSEEAQDHSPSISANFDAETPIQKTTNNDLSYPWFTRMKESTILVNEIPVPDGFKRIKVKKGTFADWLRHMPLRPLGTKVYYFNDEKKYTQDIHEAVIDIDLSDADLQQSEDATIRLRSEYLFSQKQYNAIEFQKNNGDTIRLRDFIKNETPSYFEFRNYLEQLFKQTTVASLANELQYIKLGEMAIGDAFIQVGEPGHAAIVIDMAESEGGQKVFMLAQSFIPAQDIHILKNTNQYDMYGAWFPQNFGTTLYTPEWEFSINDLHRF